MKRIIISIIIICAIVFTLTGCHIDNMGFSLGTSYHIKLSGGNAIRAKADIIDMLRDIDNKLSTSIKTSDVYRINHSTVNEPVTVSDLTILMYNLSYELYIESDAAFNVTIFPIVDLWNFSPQGFLEDSFIPPTDDEIEGLLPYTSFNNFIIDDENMTITRKSDRAMLDFGGIAKGYAVERALEIARSYNVKQAIINIGGAVGIIGEKNVGITHPRKSREVFASFIMEDGESVNTSGDYHRYYIYEDERYHHIMDSSTGKPADNGIIAVTIVSRDGLICDALSTAVFVMGAEDGMAYAESKNVKCLIIMDDMTYRVSLGWDIIILDGEYTEYQ